ncbi:MAG TPA: D-2-hydroxyacid dehydrogenase [Pirellulales bacterium]|jgi:D-3-phosphoglycerate dehydrogenase|nr:D-2-hydroxyacid dehydrogenase [Pirellulales bacterium]
MRIVLCYPVEPRHVAQIQAVVPQAEICDASQEAVARELFACDVFCGHPKVPVDWEGVVRTGQLKWIQSSAAGLDHLLVPSVVASSIVVTSASGVLSDQVAEHTVALVTGLLRGLPEYFRAQQKKEYIRRPTRDLHHCTVGIVGLGGVGRRVAELLAPFKTRILATDFYPVDKPLHVAELWPANRLDDLLAAVDVLVLCVPLTEETRWMINAKTLAKLKPGAVLANMARGKLVVENDLVAALQSGHLFGAVLDVAAEEPLPPESKLWDLSNVIITPHVAGQSRWRIDNMTDFFCDNLRRYLAGQSLRNLVDKRLGFPIRKASTQSLDAKPVRQMPR